MTNSREPKRAQIFAVVITTNLWGADDSFFLELKPHLRCRPAERIGITPRGLIGTHTVITDNSIGPSLRSIIRVSGAGSSSKCRCSRWLDGGTVKSAWRKRGVLNE
jgi:hypothetical protein